MKSLKFLAAALAVAGALIQQASAQTTHIYITGSSAFRTAAIAAIATVTHSGTGPGQNGIVQAAGGGTGNDTAYNAANPLKGQTATSTDNTTFIWEGGWITNTDSSTTPVTVCATFTGSQTGIATTLASPAITIPFLPDGSTGVSNPSAYIDVQAALPNLTTQSYTGTDGLTHSGLYSPSVENTPSFCFSDVFQATTAFNGSVNLGTPFNETATYSAAADHPVAFVTFKWMASKNFPQVNGASAVNEGIWGSSFNQSSISVEPENLKKLFTSGTIPLALLSGRSVDQHILVYATGRNPDSGTRGVALTDSGIGNFTNLNQFQPTGFNAAGAVSTMQQYPVETVAGLSTVNVGNSGEATGATLRGYLNDTLASGNGLHLVNPANNRVTNQATTVTAAYLLTYLGTSDANSVAANAVELPYKGTYFCDANGNTNIYNGAYTFWGVEHIYDAGSLSGTVLQTETNVITTLTGTSTANLSKAGISLLDVFSSGNPTGPFVVKRTADGGSYTLLYTP